MICIIDCGTSWLQEIKDNLSDSDYKSKVIKLDEIENSDFKSFSGIVISGAPTLLTQVNQQEYLDKFSFLKSIKIPVLGICLGHQILGLLHGSQIKAEKMIDKMEQIEILQENDLFNGIQNLSEFREEHSEFISLPEDFIHLAKSESCDNESMKHKNKNLFGVQFHPEVSGDNGKQLFNNFLKLC
ncbi:MAG: gamma-glutamyl-gamma-aminobutyrate hydrolase family protein [Nanoarchaeota archaeon]|nr:gamma-glutamyl-gamma-aminobutyrate hydrolase family protein [Nanoarchaeota archaeon]MBU1031025.1 gamma-glutamyl-gamma-aminobutyrate hydrolase family protein [Nanoarchaeota archaeon]